MKKLTTLILFIVFIWTAAACAPIEQNGPDPTVTLPPTAEDNVLFGIGEPLTSSNVRNFSLDITAKLTGRLGAKSYRMWFTATNTFTGWAWDKVMSDDALSSLSENTKRMYRAQIELLRDNGITEITGMGHFLPRVASTVGGSGNFVPRRDTSENSDYMQFLNKVQIIWETMAASFPEITIWEVGNENNHLPFTNYMGEGDATYTELAEICTDYMYYAYAGVKKGNADATVLTPGFAPVSTYYLTQGEFVKNGLGLDSVLRFMEMLYGNIKSGSYPAGKDACTEPDKYFDGVAYHPYDLGEESNSNSPFDKDEFDIRKWVDANNRIYQLMADNGDGDKQVWLTEFGLTTQKKFLIETDAQDTDIKVYNVENKYYKTTDEFEERQSYFISLYFDAMQSQEMHYVRTCHFFRMYGCTIDYSWNGFTVLYYGMFFEPSSYLDRGFYPRHKAYRIQEIYGGTGDLAEFASYSAVG